MSWQTLAEWLIAEVRDKSVAEVDRRLAGSAKDAQARRWREITADPKVREALDELAPDIVDMVVFNLLWQVDEGVLSLEIADGESVMQTEDSQRGEMAGWFEGSPGWRHSYARERFNDYYSGVEDKQKET